MIVRTFCKMSKYVTLSVKEVMKREQGSWFWGLSFALQIDKIAPDIKNKKFVFLCVNKTTEHRFKMKLMSFLFCALSKII
jgi:hypothetical protein